MGNKISIFWVRKERRQDGNMGDLGGIAEEVIRFSSDPPRTSEKSKE